MSAIVLIYYIRCLYIFIYSLNKKKFVKLSNLTGKLKNGKIKHVNNKTRK